MKKWGIVIDLGQCIGCDSCSAVCQQVHGPESNWRVVYDLGIRPGTDMARLSMPMSCMHCSNAPCVEVCPTTASYIRQDGIVALDYDKCIGCGYCIMACPYDARVLSPLGKIALRTDGAHTSSAEIATKCTMCAPKLDSGIAAGFRPGLDPQATPECVVTCSAKALTFGDLNDPASQPSLLVRSKKHRRLLEELQTSPSVYFLLPHSKSTQS
jgi:phenylacetyl-CoA:acceptor oxidoreductase 27-kDa subunit